MSRSSLPRLREIRSLIAGFHGLDVLFYRGADAFVGRGAFAERLGGVAKGYEELFLWLDLVVCIRFWAELTMERSSSSCVEVIVDILDVKKGRFIFQIDNGVQILHPKRCISVFSNRDNI